MKKKSYPTVLFYTSLPRAFRTTLIGHLYEISQIFPTIVLSEKLDEDSKNLISNKRLFPKIEKIIPVKQFSEEKTGVFKKNEYLYQKAKEVIEQYKPKIVIVEKDFYPFELYLLRFAKKAKAITIAVQATNEGEVATIGRLIDLTNVYLRTPSFLPKSLRFLFVKLRKSFGHFFYYWILPATLKERPFLGKSSYILRIGCSGMRDADFQVILSKRDSIIFQKNGLALNKILILNHPLARKTRYIFEKIYPEINNKEKNIITVLLPGDSELGFRRSDRSLISKEERENIWVESLKRICMIFPRWKIYIKPHPNTRELADLNQKLRFISKNIEVIDPEEPAGKYLGMAKLIIELPPSLSTVIFFASMLYPQKPIISLNFFREMMGDFYEDFKGVEYVDNQNKFAKLLEQIKNNKYKKEFVQNPDEPKFKDCVDVLNYILSLNNI